MRELSAKDQAAIEFLWRGCIEPSGLSTRPFRSLSTDPSLTLPLVSDYGNGKSSKDDDDLNNDDTMMILSKKMRTCVESLPWCRSSWDQRSSPFAHSSWLRREVGSRICPSRRLTFNNTPLLYYLFRELPHANRIGASLSPSEVVRGQWDTSFPDLRGS